MTTKDRDFIELEQAIVELHHIARLVERDIGPGELSRSLRENADTLSALVRYSIV